jgi:cyanophycinase-like exopeptidase
LLLPHQISKEIGPKYVSFAYLDATNIDVLYIDKREEAADEAVLTRLKAADIVIFTGGDQLRLTSILGGTAFKIFYWINTRMKNLFMLEHLLLQQLLTI